LINQNKNKNRLLPDLRTSVSDFRERERVQDVSMQLLGKNRERERESAEESKIALISCCSGLGLIK